MSFQQPPPPAYSQPTAPPPHMAYPAPQPQPYPPPQAYPALPQPQPQPQPVYGPPAMQPSAAMASNVTVVQTGRSGGPGGFRCPSCHATSPPTVTRRTPGSAWMWVFLLFLLGFIFPILWLGLCFIPLCVMTERSRSCGVCGFNMGQA